MQNTTEYQGICPICYKPIRNVDEVRTVQTLDREETYHAFCMLDWVRKNTPERADTEGIGMTLLEEHKKLFIGHSMQKREMYMTTKYFEWKAWGEHYKTQRERIGLSLAHVAARLGISVGRVKRFENGEPVKDARLINNAYMLLLLYIDREYELIQYREYFQQTNEHNQSEVTREA